MGSSLRSYEMGYSKGLKVNQKKAFEELGYLRGLDEGLKRAASMAGPPGHRCAHECWRSYFPFVFSFLYDTSCSHHIFDADALTLRA